MTLTSSIVIMLVAYVFGAITKMFIDTIPNKFIPIQNVLIGVLSGIICFYLKINDTLLEAILLGIMSTMSAGGLADLIDTKKVLTKKNEDSFG